MDFHGLARRELQALCKKNKIPANITNVAMADALSALPYVEGIEEMMMLLQSPEKVGINSSKTGLTSTRGRKTVTKEPESSQPVSRSRLGSRRRITEDPEVDESKKEDLQTPAVRKRAPVVASSCRKKVEESSVQRVYSTRRSVRLAEQMAGLSLDEGVEKTKTGNIECDLSKNNFVNCDKVSDIGSEKKAVTEEALNEKVDMQGVADITPAGDGENETDVKDNVAVVNAEPDVIPNVEVKHECKVEECNDEAKVETKQYVGCELSTKEESVQALQNFDAMEPELQVEEKSNGLVDGENSYQKPSGSFDDLEITNEESASAVEDFRTMELESVTDEEKSTGIEDAESRNQVASLEQQESGEEETGVHCTKGVEDSDSDGSVIASDDDSDDTTEDDSSSVEESDDSVIASDDDSCKTTEVDPSSAEACDKIAASEIEADAESTLTIKEKASATPIKQQTMASETDKLVSGISETEEKFASEADVESSVIAEEPSSLPLEKEESIVTEQEKMKMELKSNDKENFGAYEEKKMKMVEVKEQENKPYGDLSLRQLSKMLKAFHLENNGKKNDHQKKKNVAAVKDQVVGKTARTALQVLPENHQMTETEKEN